MTPGSLARRWRCACLAAAMIFSASAVTAEQQYGHSYIFLVRQAAWLFIGLLGMFALMKTDYRRLREPCGDLSRSLRCLALARRHTFSGQVSCHSSLDQVWTCGHPAVGTGKTRDDSLSGVVLGSKAP